MEEHKAISHRAVCALWVGIVKEEFLFILIFLAILFLSYDAILSSINVILFNEEKGYSGWRFDIFLEK